jgi:hypothetical protein
LLLPAPSRRCSHERDQELWGIALWLEKTKGSEAPDHIAREVARLAAEDDQAGIAMGGRCRNDTTSFANPPRSTNRFPTANTM